MKVYRNTLALKILFHDKIATGVAVSTQGLDYTLTANKEVIISSGAFQSPHILMVSGIGPKNLLQGLGIPLLVDAPGVGQNLQDQPWFGSSFRVNFPTASALQNNPALLSEAVEAYFQNASGPLAVIGGGAFGWEKLPDSLRANLSTSTRKALAAFPPDWPEIEWLPVSAYFGYQTNYQTADPRDGYNYATLQTVLIAPLSRGNISINSSSMLDPPLINPNWLTDPADVEFAIATLKRQRQIWSVLSSYNITIGEEAFPGPTVQSDAEILDFIRRAVAPIWHPSATCKMGRANDSMAVIDSEARVYGVDHLRVVDASSFPFLPPGHPQSTVYALAMKIAHQILGSRIM